MTPPLKEQFYAARVAGLPQNVDRVRIGRYMKPMCAPSRATYYVRSTGKSLFGRSPTSAGATFDTSKPAVCLCRAEQASIAVAPVRVLAVLTRAICRHGTGLQRQARCLSHQIGPTHSVRCGRAALDAGRNFDRAKIAARPHGFRDPRGSLRGLFARSLSEQCFECFDQSGVPAIGLETMQGLVNTCRICLGICFFFHVAKNFGAVIDANIATT